MKVLSLAHGAVPEYFDKDGVKEKFFNGPSPDEVALVQFASSVGYDCMDTKEEEISARLRAIGKSTGEFGGGNYDFPMNEEKTYEVIRRMQFNSDRKRMSILLKDPNDGKYKLFIKGADSIIKARLDKS